MDVVQAFTAMRKAADGFVVGDVDGDDLHSAVVDYTDALWPNWPGEPTRNQKTTGGRNDEH